MVGKIVGDTKPQSLTISGKYLYIRWDIEYFEDEEHSGWEYYEAVVPLVPQRSYLIQTILASQLSLADEVALINNYNGDTEDRAAEYAEYQNLRATAKRLADEAITLMVSGQS